MKTETKRDAPTIHRKSERGAALVTVLLLSILLLSAGLALMVTTSLSAITAIDATAEMQAYFGAEAGIEATLNALRGNVAPDSSLSGTKINFRNAAWPATANKTSDPWASGASAAARLSGWLKYTYQSPSTTNDWRVPITASYAPLTGIAYKVLISDPDDPGPLATRRITTDATYEPSRLMIQSEGYGPKGSIKRLEMVVKRSAIELATPATVTLAGGPSNLTLGSGGDSYSGNDQAIPPHPQLPAFAVSGSTADAQIAINSDCVDVDPCDPLQLVSSNTPSFLQSADAARAFLNEMRTLASSLNRLFPDKASAIAAGGLGTTSNPQFTFIDNYASGTAVDLGSNHQGNGLLIVTGELLTNGNTDFEGVILVLGRGRVTRSGGGNGSILGTIIVANFDPYGAPGDPFGSSTFNMAGGGTSSINYDSEWIERALDSTGIGIVGLREYH